ncbi:MAG TPA: hypothetical protein VIU41_12410 [Geobacteraceae bacterium]
MGDMFWYIQVRYAQHKVIELDSNHFYKTWVQMRFTNLLTIAVTISIISMNGIGYCDSGLQYGETVAFIKNALPGISSDVRKESYGYIRFNECNLDYNVAGNYPVGTSYDISFKQIDFSSLNYQKSKVGVDSSYFIILNFNKSFISRIYSNERTVSTVVIDAASNEQAQTLFKAFLHLGELCGAGKSPL